ncbi:Rad2 nuclease [Orbilia javanica]|uniref:Rad2 nuclease n=1 Tax=Orbilia javanica TaxID=47235 RepID=A0AAN8MV91_9PEZI
MGINGLLPFLKSIQQPTHIKNWRGKRVAVDAYGWLHRGTISCAVDLALGKHTTRYVDYAMHRVRMLQHYGVTPYLVFDGDYLPGKKGTEVDREQRRKSSRETGLELLRLGRTSQAHAELQKSIDVTPLMARHLIEELSKANIPYVVAPYEADAQMAYLESIGEVSAILSEDSDLLVFGAKCLLTKLDQYGECIAIHRTDFPKVSDTSMAGWSDSEFCRMAILSGCDYLVNIPKMGIKTAYKFVRKYRSVEKIMRAIRMDGSFVVPASYEKAFIAAEMTFKYQRVYCPISCRLISCNGDATLPDSVGIEQEQNFGDIYDSKTASKVASGELDPITKLELQTAPSPVSASLKQKSRITSFFSPRTALAELPSSQNALAIPGTPSSKIPITNSKHTTGPKDHPETGNKKRRLCMDVDNDNIQSTDQSPFFARPAGSTKTLAKNSMPIPRRPTGHRKTNTRCVLKPINSNCFSQPKSGAAGRIIRPQNKPQVKTQTKSELCRAPQLKASLALFRFKADSCLSGNLGTRGSIADSKDKENQHPACPN